MLDMKMSISKSPNWVKDRKKAQILKNWNQMKQTSLDQHIKDKIGEKAESRLKPKMFSVSQVQASSSANDKVHSAEADIESNRVQLFKCMMMLKFRDI